MKSRPIYLAAALTAFLAFFFVNASHIRFSRPQYELVWNDDFDSAKIDGRYWDFMPRRESDAGRYFSNHDSTYTLKDGILRLYAKENDGLISTDTATILTCGIETHHRITLSYGKVEVRAKIRGARGAWPAIWLRGDDDRYATYPDLAEIDIMEHLNYDNYVYQTVHTNYTDILLHHRHPRYQVQSDIDYSDFNVYAVEILPKKLIFSINGERTMSYPRIRVKEYGQFPFGCELHLMIDMQYGGQWVGPADNSTLPAYIDIDWVKIYRLAE